VVPKSTSEYDVNVAGIEGEGLVFLHVQDVTGLVADKHGTVMHPNYTKDSTWFYVDTVGPKIVSITTEDDNPTRGLMDLTFLVTCNEGISGLTAGHFAIVTTGGVGGTLSLSMSAGSKKLGADREG